ncbi:MAG: hypothetical protein V1678_01535 [Candidatus Aenigmatarchaeota archaeon]
MKGMMYTIEAVIGTVLILLGIMYIYPTQHQSETSLSETGYSCLSYLDKSGLLRYYATSNMSSELNVSLRNCLPSTAGFKFKVCSSSDCREDVPTGKSVYVSSYLIAGDKTYERRMINLWVWLK